MKKPLKVSVGTSALNEEKNIKRVLSSIIKQKRNKWELVEVLVYCDGCSDNTYKLAKNIKSKYLKVVNYKYREGKNARVDEMLRKFTGDVLVLVDADIIFDSNKVFTNMVRAFTKYSNVGLVGANSRVLPPKNTFQKLIYPNYEVYFKSRYFGKGNNLFGCTGACLAVSRSFAKKLDKTPEIVAQDVYFYLSSKKLEYKFIHVKNAVVYYKLASNLKDYLRQAFRNSPEAIENIYSKHFGKLVKEEYKRPVHQYIAALLSVFLRKPIATSYCVGLRLVCKPFYPLISGNYKLGWFSARSTK